MLEQLGLAQGHDQPSIPDPEPAPVLPAGLLTETFDNAEEMLLRVAEVFLNHGPQQLREIGDAIASGDAPLLRQAAHRFKGSLGSFGAKDAVAAAF